LLNSKGSTGLFTAIAWTDIAARFNHVARGRPEFQYMADITASVLDWQAADRLAGLTSMDDLVVTALPIPQSPIDTVVVRSPSSGYVGAEAVLIEHRSQAGDDEWVVRPSGQAVALFWRFMTEKFGVRPIRPDTAGNAG
jgi:hypothetical protein